MVEREVVVFHGRIFKAHRRPRRWILGPHLPGALSVVEASSVLSLPSMLLPIRMICVYWVAVALCLAGIGQSLTVVGLRPLEVYSAVVAQGGLD